MTVRFGVSLPNNQGVARVRDLVDFSRSVESLGYHSVWVSEHLWHAAYVAERLGRRPYHDALTLLTAVAAVTERVRLGTSVLVLPWHHPVRLAKTIATLDNLSGGRVDLGVGVAVTEDEYANLNVDFQTRGAMTDEMLAAMKALWTQDLPAHEGANYQFQGLAFEPKCDQAPHVPIWIGGNSERAQRRVAEFGDGWHGLGQSPEDVTKVRAGLVKACERAERDPGELKVSIRSVLDIVDKPWERPVTQRRTLKGTPDELRAMVAAYDAAGVDEIVLDGVTADLTSLTATLDRFGNEVQ